MARTGTIIDIKFLSVCSASDAVQWLKGKREQHRRSNLKFSSFRNRQEEEEETLVSRNDPYIDFGLARFGIEEKACKRVYERGDIGIRCTFLASFPNGGFNWDMFDLADHPYFGADELCALVTNESLKDNLFEDCFAKGGAFAALSENDYMDVLISASENKRLSTPYDEIYLDGYADHSYHKVFSVAWKLTETAPPTPAWAQVLLQLLVRCQPPIGFDPIPVFARWNLKRGDGDDRDDPGFYLRQRLADLLQPNDVLLNASDSALRTSFYQRFEPSKYGRWPEFVNNDGELFLDAVLSNRLVWRLDENREILSRLCWDFPDPRHMMDMPNRFRAFETRMQTERPEWFEEA
jgi:hypothetical protein